MSKSYVNRPQGLGLWTSLFLNPSSLGFTAHTLNRYPPEPLTTSRTGHMFGFRVIRSQEEAVALDA